MSEPADYSDQAEIFRKSMVEALAKLDTVADQANKAYEQAVEDQLAAKQELERIKAESYRIADVQAEMHLLLLKLFRKKNGMPSQDCLLKSGCLFMNL